MPTYTVKVYEAPLLAEYAGKRDSSGRQVVPPKPRGLPGFTVSGRNIDAARRAAKLKLSGSEGSRIRSLSVGRDGCVHVVLMSPTDAMADRPLR